MIHINIPLSEDEVKLALQNKYSTIKFLLKHKYTIPQIAKMYDTSICEVTNILTSQLKIERE